jgi:chromosome partitioning protein
MKAKVYAAVTWKGGTGKTTLNVYFSKSMAQRGKKVLVIDLDSNCAISQCFGKVMQDVTSLEFLSGGWENFTGVIPAGDIDIIPGNIRNALMNNIMDTQLKISLKKSGVLEKYDYVVIDPPGTWGAHSRNAVFAADVLIIPGTCSRIDLEATRLFFSTLQDCCVDADCFVVMNAFNKKTSLPGIDEAYREAFGDFLIPEPIPYIQSLKKLTADVNYPVAAAVKKRLERFVDYVIKPETAEGGENA